MHLMSTTKTLIPKLREGSLETLLEKVISFCKYQDIHIPNMDVSFSNVRQSRCKIF